MRRLREGSIYSHSNGPATRIPLNPGLRLLRSTELVYVMFKPEKQTLMTAALPALPFHCQHFVSALGEWEFLIAPPPPDLAGIVACFWISRGRVTFLHEKILPQNNI